MKRSEMLEMVDLVLALGIRERSERAEKILEVIEKSGMLPPESKLKVQRDLELRMGLRTGLGQGLDLRMPRMYFHAWDEED